MDIKGLIAQMYSNDETNIAVLDYSTGREISYAELIGHVNDVIDIMKYQEIEMNEPTVIVSKNIYDTVASIIAILYYGAQIEGCNVSLGQIEAEIARISKTSMNISRQPTILVSSSFVNIETLVASVICGAKVVILDENSTDVEVVRCLKRVRPHLVVTSTTYAEKLVRADLYQKLLDAKNTNMLSFAHTRRMVFRQLKRHFLFTLGGCIQSVAIYDTKPFNTEIEQLLKRIEFPYQLIPFVRKGCTQIL